jgi:hypothetical protein
MLAVVDPVDVAIIDVGALGVVIEGVQEFVRLSDRPELTKLDADRDLPQYSYVLNRFAPPKALLPIEVTLLGITSEVRLLVRLKAKSPIVVTLVPSVNVSNLTVLLNAAVPIAITLFGIISEVR